jgi:hypothetical protein
MSVAVPAGGVAAAAPLWEPKLVHGMPGGKLSFRFGDSANSMFDLLFITVMFDPRTLARTCEGGSGLPRVVMLSRFPRR